MIGAQRHIRVLQEHLQRIPALQRVVHHLRQCIIRQQARLRLRFTPSKDPPHHRLALFKPRSSALVALKTPLPVLFIQLVQLPDQPQDHLCPLRFHDLSVIEPPPGMHPALGVLSSTAEPSSSSTPRTRTKGIHVKVRASATAATATDFLHEALLRLPVSSVQVDGGSEFMQEFETARRDAGIPPRMSSHHAAPTVTATSSAATAPCAPSGPSTGAASGEVNQALEGSLLDHHNVRPHHALGLWTPTEFTDKLFLVA